MTFMLFEVSLLWNVLVIYILMLWVPNRAERSRFLQHSLHAAFIWMRHQGQQPKVFFGFFPSLFLKGESSVELTQIVSKAPEKSSLKTVRLMNGI